MKASKAAQKAAKTLNDSRLPLRFILGGFSSLKEKDACLSLQTMGLGLGRLASQCNVTKLLAKSLSNFPNAIDTDLLKELSKPIKRAQKPNNY